MEPGFRPGSRPNLYRMACPICLLKRSNSPSRGRRSISVMAALPRGLPAGSLAGGRRRPGDRGWREKPGPGRAVWRPARPRRNPARPLAGGRCRASRRSRREKPGRGRAGGDLLVCAGLPHSPQQVGDVGRPVMEVGVSRGAVCECRNLLFPVWDVVQAVELEVEVVEGDEGSGVSGAAVTGSNPARRTRSEVVAFRVSRGWHGQ